ncbi:MAG TPA: phage tail sheath subtilisin-like domain-containing protein [Bradyrhizobium sp.]|nr:phage tail sheath subtilisin-like domain-containing protein [Bradyrhizobium sp.]
MPSESAFPGAYVEEQSFGSRSIAGVATSVAAFIGPTQRGPVARPVEVRSFSEFEQRFGELLAALETGYAVRQYFVNGGSQAWVVRVAKNPNLPRLQAALHSLDEVDLVNLLVLPGLTTPAVVALAAGYCQTRRAFLVVDAPATAKTPEQMEEAARTLTFDSKSHAAIYYPWVRIEDPLNKSQPRLSPPSGTIAGMIARLDAMRGVWKAPAGTEANLQGVATLERKLTDAENGRLNSRGVNCLRSFPAHSLVAWGARTLAGDDQSASEFKYIPVRRTALFIEESVSRGSQWAAFEPNDEPLWAQLRLQVGAFMHRLFQQGAFQGVAPKDGYFVKCDRETTTRADVAAGVVNILIGFAPLKPAEFVVIKIQQLAGSTIP